MSTTVDALRLRRVMGRRRGWLTPQPFGPDGWTMTATDGRSVVVSAADFDGALWIHASIASPDETPSYDDLCQLYRAVWGGTGYAYQCFVPPAEHVNIHQDALHLWGRADGARVLPNFAPFGSI